MVSTIGVVAIAVVGILATVGITQRDQIQAMFLANTDNVNPSNTQNQIPATTVLQESNKPSATECKIVGQRLSDKYYCSFGINTNGDRYFDVKEIAENQTQVCGGVRIDSISIHPSGSGELVVDKPTNCTDKLKTIGVSGVGQVNPNYVLNLGATKVTIPFNLGTELKAGSQVTVGIVFQSGATIAQGLTVSPAEVSPAITSYSISNSQWIYSGDNNSVLTFTATNTGNTVMHITNVHVGTEQYGKTFAYSATVQPNNSQKVVINTSGSATRINAGNIFPFTVYTSEGINNSEKVLLTISDEELAREKALAEEKARQEELATPKSGIITITSATLKVGSDSSVTIKNLLPNTCSGANWCNNVIIDYIYVDGRQVNWVHFPNWTLMADSRYTQPFVGATKNTGTIRITGHVSDSGQQIYAEYTIR